MEALRIGTSIILLVCCVLGVFTDNDVATNCLNEMENCIKRLDEKHDFIVDLTSPSAMNFKFMFERCDELQLFAICLNAVSPDCPKNVVHSYKGYIDFIDYFCGSGVDLSLKYSECLGNNSTLADMKECAMTYASKYQSSGEDAAYMCGYLDDYEDCLRGVARDACGQDAAVYMNEILRRLIDQNKEVIGCTASRFFVSILLVVAACLTAMAV